VKLITSLPHWFYTRILRVPKCFSPQAFSLTPKPAHNLGDNASCESFLKTLKREEIYANDCRDLDHLLGNIEAFIEQYYNRCRLHSALGYRSPEEFEREANTGVAGSDPRIAPRLIVPMSLQLVIPRRVALQQSSPPLHQPSITLKEKKKFEKEKPVNGKCANSKLSQRRGSPQSIVPKLCQILPADDCPVVGFSYRRNCL
jgi:hypothetical protein